MSESEPDAVQRTFYPDGSPREEIRHHGVWRRWHPSGQLAGEWRLRHGVYDGTSRTWYPDGTLQAECVHRDGQQISVRIFGPDGAPLAGPDDFALKLKRWAAQATLRGPVRRRKVDPEVAARHGAFIAERLAAGTSPA